jgi:hypothetical protein
MNSVMAKRLYRIYDPIEKLEALVAGWVEIMQDTSIDFMEIMMDFWAEGVRKKQEKMMFDLKSMYDEYRRMVVEILEDGIAKGRIKPINTTCTASILIGAIDGLMLQWIMDRDLFKLEEISEVFNKSFIEGLKTD